MTPPPLIPTRPVSAKVLAPWGVFAVLVAAAVVTFFLYADRVPSLMQALADR